MTKRNAIFKRIPQLAAAATLGIGGQSAEAERPNILFILPRSHAIASRGLKKVIPSFYASSVIAY